jgi:DegV family protein with EDD domain
VLPVSSRLSASHQAAVAAAAGDARATVLDGLTVSAGTVLLADGIQRLVEGGATLAEVERWFAAARERIRVLIAVDTLEYLRRGGRISRTAHVTGTALGVHPLLTIEAGEVEPVGRAFGRSGVWRAFERFVRSCPDGGPMRVGIAHAGAPEAAERLEQLVCRIRPDSSIDRVCQIGPVVAAHGGPGTLGLLVLPEA